MVGRPIVLWHGQIIGQPVNVRHLERGINQSGGRLSMGHPPQATPLLEVGSVFERLTGDATVGLVQTEHGMMNGAAVAVLEAFAP